MILDHATHALIFVVIPPPLPKDSGAGMIGFARPEVIENESATGWFRVAIEFQPGKETTT